MSATPSVQSSELYGTYEGKVFAPFEATDQEILTELFGVIEAVEQKAVKLTKSGIPPKPLWTAINQRLIWSDPSSLLYDWEEVDQVRFIFRLSLQLDTIRIDPGGWINTGAGADQFFFAEAVDRARMLLLAYLNLPEWDERCDARNDEGHRFNFGRAFRRDFIRTPRFVRETVFSRLKRMPDGWVSSTQLAKDLTDSHPDLLISEVCDLPALNEEGIDAEKLRFLSYWLALLARFGWVDIGRAIDDGLAWRTCRLTDLGRQLIRAERTSPAPRKAVLVEEDTRLFIRADEGQVSDCFAARRLASGNEVTLDDDDDDFIRGYQVSRESVAEAASAGVDVAAALAWITRHAHPAPPSQVAAWVEEELGQRDRVRITSNLAGIEYGDSSPPTEALAEVGLCPVGDLVLAPGHRQPDLYEAIGSEPKESFDYPWEEPLAEWQPGPVLQLFYEKLPMIHRELLELLEPEGDPPSVALDAPRLKRAIEQGWTVEAVVKALSQLTAKKLSAKARKKLEKLVS